MIYKKAMQHIILLFPSISFALQLGISGEGYLNIFNERYNGPVAFVCPMLKFNHNNIFFLRFGFGFITSNANDTIVYMNGRKAWLDYALGLEYCHLFLQSGHAKFGVIGGPTYTKFNEKLSSIVLVKNSYLDEYNAKTIETVISTWNIQTFVGIFCSYDLNDKISIFSKFGAAMIYTPNSYRIHQESIYSMPQDISTVKNNDNSISIRTLTNQFGLIFYF